MTAREGSALSAEWSLGDGPSVLVTSAAPLGAAQNRAISLEMLREQFGRLGGTAYTLGDVSLDVEGSPFAPVSVLNQMRREAVERLQALQAAASQPRHVACDARGW